MSKIIITIIIITVAMVFVYGYWDANDLIDIQKNEFYFCKLNKSNHLTCEDKKNKKFTERNVIKFKMSSLNICIMTKAEIKCHGPRSLVLKGFFEDFELSDDVICSKGKVYNCKSFDGKADGFFDKIKEIDMEKLTLLDNGFCYQKDYRITCTSRNTVSNYYYQDSFEDKIETNDGLIFCAYSRFNIKCKMDSESDYFLDFSFDSEIKKVTTYLGFGCILLINGKLTCWKTNSVFMKQDFFENKIKFKRNNIKFYIYERADVLSVNNVEENLCILYGDNKYKCLEFK
jgi:hypothetical protein